jgi:putative transposase
MRKEIFVPGEYYHIYNRIIFNKPEFKNRKNAERLARAFLLGNSTKSSAAFEYLKSNKNATLDEAIKITKTGEKLVDIICYSIMPDHYHLLVKEKVENGISNFLHKCNVSIAKYINIKNNRKGPLFESRFDAKHIDTNKYLVHLSIYIHLNPLDFLDGKKWRKHKLKNWPAKKKKLLDYPWSSLRMFLNKNFQDPIISNTKIILNQFDKNNTYEKSLQEWSEEHLEKINNIL